MIAISSPPFYSTHVQLPKAPDPTPEFISSNPLISPWFNQALGAMDGTHIACTPSAENRCTARNRKGWFSQNCLACVSWDLRFLYVTSGWEGSATDALVFADSRLTELRIPAGRFYLADAGFGACDSLLVPYCGV